MVHVRLNQRETNPNPHINFIVPLTTADPAAEEEARQLLRALAAQVRPLMKAEGYVVNSLEEYEHNRVFAGRNWNSGEVVELVLRGAGGNFLPTSWLLSTLCHELAHIKALWTKLRKDVRELQNQGYYGDGYWSSGTRLSDSARTGSQGLDAGDLPEYMCGGAQARTRPTSLRRRRARGAAGPSIHTGAQTAKKRKAGSRVTAQGLFKGSGRALNEDVGEDEKKAGVGFRKKAGSKRAREQRLLAVERRMQALQDGGVVPANKEESDEEKSEYEDVSETDQDRRRTVLDSADKSELDGLKAWQHDYSSEFLFPSVASTSNSKSSPQLRLSSASTVGPSTDSREHGTIELSSDEDEPHQVECDMQSITEGTSSNADTINSKPSKDLSSNIVRTKQVGLGSWLQVMNSPSTAPVSKGSTNQKVAYGALVQDEVRSRVKESLGMNDPGRRLGGTPSGQSPGAVQDAHRRPHGAPSKQEELTVPSSTLISSTVASWTCQVCTLVNEPVHLACSACATPRGDSIWAGNSV